jgi:flagellar hook-basal body complex protein FliE
LIGEVKMQIEGFGDFLPGTIKTQKPTSAVGDSFGNTFADLIKDVNQDQLNSQQTVNDFVSGNGVELHEVMIAGEKAKTSLQLLMEIRNKAVDMFKELTRMPV